MKKDILFLCQFFYPEHNSSATLPFDTAKYLASHDFLVDALVGYPKEYSDEASVPMKDNVEGVGIQRIQYIQLRRVSKFGRLVNYFSFTLSALFHLVKLRRYKCVIVYSNPPILPFVAVLGNLLFGTKIIFVAYDVYPEVAFASNSLRPGSVIDKGMRCLNHLLFRRVSRVVALTEEMKAFLIEHRPEITAEKIVTIANWAHEKKAVPSAAAYERFGYQPGEFIVSYFGNMGICQEMQTLVQTVERMSDYDNVKFLFIGHGSKKEAIEERFKQKRLTNVQMYDFLTGEAFEQAVAISSCCVVSLEKGLMGTCAPSKYYSYLQGGHPVLAVVEKGSYLAEEVEAKEIGHAVEIGNVDGLVNAIQSMVEDRAGCVEMGKRAEKLYEERYALEIGLSKYADAIRVVLKD